MGNKLIILVVLILLSSATVLANSVKGNASNITTINIQNLTVLINGTTNLSKVFNGTLPVEFRDQWYPITTFKFNFSKNTLDLTTITIQKQAPTTYNGHTIITGLNISQNTTKNTTVEHWSNMNTVCIKTSQINNTSQISAGCNSPDEHIITCNGTQQQNYTCTLDQDWNFKITGKNYTSAIERCGDNDRDGYGTLCKKGNDCDDNNPTKHYSCNPLPPAPGVRYFGDGDGDGNITTTDKKIIQDYTLMKPLDCGVTPSCLTLDLDGDGILSGKDMIILRRIILGKTTQVKGAPTKITNNHYPTNVKIGNVFNISVNVTAQTGIARPGIGVLFTIDNTSTANATLTGRNPTSGNNYTTAKQVFELTNKITEGGKATIQVTALGAGTLIIKTLIPGDTNKKVNNITGQNITINITYTCTTNNECDDSNSSTIDICFNKATPQATCINGPPNINGTIYDENGNPTAGINISFYNTSTFQPYQINNWTEYFENGIIENSTGNYTTLTPKTLPDIVTDTNGYYEAYLPNTTPWHMIMQGSKKTDFEIHTKEKEEKEHDTEIFENESYDPETDFEAEGHIIHSGEYENNNNYTCSQIVEFTMFGQNKGTQNKTITFAIENHTTTGKPTHMRHACDNTTGITYGEGHIIYCGNISEEKENLQIPAGTQGNNKTEKHYVFHVPCEFAPGPGKRAKYDIHVYDNLKWGNMHKIGNFFVYGFNRTLLNQTNTTTNQTNSTIPGLGQIILTLQNPPLLYTNTTNNNYTLPTQLKYSATLAPAPGSIEYNLYQKYSYIFTLDYRK